MSNVIPFDAAMVVLRRELEALGMRIGYSDRAGYFVTDAETSETMMIINNNPERFMALVRRFNAKNQNRQASRVLAQAEDAVSANG